VYIKPNLRVKNTDLDHKLQFGLRIKEMRDQLQMSQEDLAEASGLFRTYMSRIETGQANPSLLVIHRLANALKASPSVLFNPVLTPLSRKTRSAQKLSRGRVK
jgi:transcriptional regulator with XRE-family HTH domain